MVTRTKPVSKTLPFDVRASGTVLTWSVLQGPASFSPGSVSYTDRTSAVDWRKLIKEGKDATTRATGFVREYNGDRTFLLAKHKVNGTYTGQQALNVTDLTKSTGHWDQAWQLAVGEFIQNAKAVKHEFNAGSFLAELRETISFLTAPIRNIRRRSERYYRQIQGRAVWRESPRSKLSRISDYWLAYRFGVYPLYTDLDSLMLELANKTVGQPPTLPVRGKGKWDGSTSDVTSGANLSIWRYRREVTDKTTTKVTIRGRMRLELPTQIIYPDDTLRVFEDFIPSLWEAMPWSWAIDYFTNIGDILNALTFLEANLTWANYTARTEREILENLTYSENSPSYEFYSSKGRNTVYRYRLWDRDSTSVGSLVPRLVFKTPIGSPIKEINLTAALMQRFR